MVNCWQHDNEFADRRCQRLNRWQFHRFNEWQLGIYDSKHQLHPRAWNNCDALPCPVDGNHPSSPRLSWCVKVVHLG